MNSGWNKVSLEGKAPGCAGQILCVFTVGHVGWVCLPLPHTHPQKSLLPRANSCMGWNLCKYCERDTGSEIHLRRLRRKSRPSDYFQFICKSRPKDNTKGKEDFSSYRAELNYLFVFQLPPEFYMLLRITHESRHIFLGSKWCCGRHCSYCKREQMSQIPHGIPGDHQPY